MRCPKFFHPNTKYPREYMKGVQVRGVQIQPLQGIIIASWALNFVQVKLGLDPADCKSSYLIYPSAHLFGTISWKSLKAQLGLDNKRFQKSFLKNYHKDIEWVRGMTLNSTHPQHCAHILVQISKGSFVLSRIKNKDFLPGRHNVLSSP